MLTINQTIRNMCDIKTVARSDEPKLKKISPDSLYNNFQRSLVTVTGYGSCIVSAIIFLSMFPHDYR